MRLKEVEAKDFSDGGNLPLSPLIATRTLLRRESNPGSHVTNHMSVILISSSGNQLSEAFVVSNSLRTHSTKSCVDKG